ncbi:hypothetical protein CKF54_00540 [Psittacicella hinzii]|uniref:VTT domain-containing protein n=1 Tax=Psittacicella hinzii TaxID=2028575 RepID=A0A3A1YBG8_9GAMM|nr:DedA family protein [Psittacicella hinzii]RIY34518.1 hypothetical protein CKF54_00540 [Psittacicella hinzii]
MDSLIALFEHFAEYGNIISYILVFAVLMLSGFGVPIPEDITLVTAGILASQGYAHGYGIFLVCMAGVLIGDSCMYILGYIYGVKLLRVKFLRKILTAKRIKTIRYRFQDNAILFLFVARFLPGLRAAIYLFSGITRKVSYTKFILIDFFASIISVPVWVSLGYFFGNNLEHLKHLVSKIGLGFTVAAVIGFILIFVFIKIRIRKREKSLSDSVNKEQDEELYLHAKNHSGEIKKKQKVKSTTK